MGKTFEISGILHVKNEELQITERFKKRTFVIIMPDHSARDQFMQLSLLQDSCSMIDDFEVGDSISVNFNINGREWTNKETSEVSYFNDIVAYRVIKLDMPIQSLDTSGDGDDLPF